MIQAKRLEFDPWQKNFSFFFKELVWGLIHNRSRGSGTTLGLTLNLNFFFTYFIGEEGKSVKILPDWTGQSIFFLIF
jgi:hypothetical protein